MNRRFFCKCIAGAVAAIAASGCTTLSSTGSYLEVDTRLCIGCGQCVRVCKGDAITVLDNNAFIDVTKCIQCGNCVKVCPYDAII
jgi:ferredoxin